MARKATPPQAKSSDVKAKITAAAIPVSATAVRYTPLPKTATPAAKAPAATTPTPAVANKVPTTSKVVLSHDAIASRAFEIHASGAGGSEVDNWLRAERELRAA